MTKSTLLMLSCTLIFTVGCTTQRLGDFTILSTKNVELSKLGTYERRGLRGEGSDVKNALAIYFGAVASMEEAVDEVIESVPGCRALVDVTVKSVTRSFSAGYEVEGECLVDPELADRIAESRDRETR